MNVQRRAVIDCLAGAVFLSFVITVLFAREILRSSSFLVRLHQLGHSPVPK